MRTFDTVVVGSGFGGLTAAALAARSGMSVALFERHSRPGGCAGDFALEGFWFPAGATVVTGLEEGGILRQVFDALGESIASQPLDPSITFHVGGGLQLPYASDVTAWQQTLHAALPSSPRYDAFWDWTHRVGGEVYRIGTHLPSLPLRRLSDVRRTARALSPSLLPLVPLLPTTIGKVMRRLRAVGEPELDAMVDSLLMDATGAPASECSAIQGAIALDLYRRGCQWVDGGTGRLAMNLVRAIRREGGEVAFNTGVTSLRRDGNQWVVELSSGETVRTERVIANMPPAALDRLLGRRIRPTTHRGSWGAFVLHLGIDAAGLETMSPFHQVVPVGNRPSSLVSIFPSRKRDQPRWSISVSTHVRAGDWRSFPSRVACQRAEMEQQLVQNAEEVIPDVRKRILLQRSATPATFERFTSRPGGFVGGLIQRPDVVALRAPNHRPERGLYLAGDHVFPGQGTVGTALSGINAYRDAIESLAGRPIL